MRRLIAVTGERKPLLVAVSILLVLFAAIFAWRTTRMANASPTHATPPVEVQALTVRAETLPQSIEATGSLSAVNAVMLAPEIAGRVTAIGFSAGDRVGRGATLLQLSDGPERADRVAAVSRMNFARIQYERSRELAPSGAEPRQLLEQREAELAQARAAIEQIDARLAQRVVRAPFAGQIGVRRVDPGQYLNAGEGIATLTALDRLHIDFTVPQQQLSRLAVGGSVTVRSDAYPERSFAARINAIEPVVGDDTRNVSVQAVMDNPGGILRPGLYVSVAIAQQERGSAILLPTTAIQTSASGDSVFVVKDGKAVPVPVVTGAQIGERILVERGVKSGDTVVTSGQLRLRAGAAVKVARIPAPRS